MGKTGGNLGLSFKQLKIGVNRKKGRGSNKREESGGVRDPQQEVNFNASRGGIVAATGERASGTSRGEGRVKSAKLGAETWGQQIVVAAVSATEHQIRRRSAIRS